MINLQANTIPGIRANLLVRLVDVPVNLPVEPTELGQGGAGALGSRDLSIPCPLWACTGAPSSRDNLSCCSSSTYLGFGPRPKGPHPRGWRGEKEKNGYPFTTFTDFSDFLGMILGVLSDDLATYVDLATRFIAQILGDH